MEYSKTQNYFHWLDLLGKGSPIRFDALICKMFLFLAVCSSAIFNITFCFVREIAKFNCETLLKEMKEKTMLLCLLSKLIRLGLFIKPGIQERGTECGECEERGECSLRFRGISKRIPGNVIILTFRGMLKKIPGNVQEHSGECSRRFRGMFKKIPGNVQEDSGESKFRFIL